MTMIERVALAMMREIARQEGGNPDELNPDWYRDLKFGYIDQVEVDMAVLAKVAIEAMLEPTEAVAREAFNHVVTDDWLDFARGYRAMITAALQEPK